MNIKYINLDIGNNTNYCEMSRNSPGGAGPWYCSLLFNTSERCKKQTHLIAHTMPHLTLDALNRVGSKRRALDEEEEDDEEDDRNAKKHWIMMLKIGPFESWNDSLAFLNLWLLRTRGKTRRLEKGFELYNTYRDLHKLHIWVQSLPLDEASVRLPISIRQDYQSVPRKRVKTKRIRVETDERTLTNGFDTVNAIFATTTSVEELEDIHNALEGRMRKKKKKIKKGAALY